MSLRSLLGRLLALLLPLSAAATIYLYLYPVFNGCAFPLPASGSQVSRSERQTALSRLEQHPLANTILQHLQISDPASETQPAIFRLLVLADPQLEGDTSLPNPEYELVPRIRTHWSSINQAISDASTTPGLPLLNADVLSNITTGLWALFNEDIPRSLSATQKRIDLLGNDFYLAHIYRTLFWWTRPTHTTVLGDLLGSQWITDEEFASRSNRYWNRVFKHGVRVDDNITWTGASDATDKDTHLEPLTSDVWARRIINVAGNHDIGYAGDVSEARMSRFEREFGRANWDIRFKHPVGDAVPTLHVINLNTLVFDTPALSEAIQSQSYSYLNDLISHRLYPVEDKSTFTLLLTHLPLHKEEGVCTDGPYFTFHDADDSDGPEGVPRFLAGGLREQNHLSDYLSDTGILQGIFGLSGDENVPGGGYGRKGLILTGHDHTGCDTVHYVEQTQTSEGESDQESDERGWKWAARRYDEKNEASRVQQTPSIREVTLRSMMGEFGGNAGLLSVWYDGESGEWDYAMTLCPAGVQHIWWAVHITILVTVIVGLLWIIAVQIEVKSNKTTTGSSKSNVVGEKTGSKNQMAGRKNASKGKAKPDRKK